MNILGLIANLAQLLSFIIIARIILPMVFPPGRGGASMARLMDILRAPPSGMASRALMARFRSSCCQRLPSAIPQTGGLHVSIANSTFSGSVLRISVAA